MLRKHLTGEAMAGLGVATTRALAAVLKGEEVFTLHISSRHKILECAHPQVALRNTGQHGSRHDSFAKALLPLLEREEGSAEAAVATATGELEQFGPSYESARLSGMRRKPGLMTERAGDAALAQELLDCVAAGGADFT